MDSIVFHPSLQLSSSISKTSVKNRNTNTRILHLRAVAVPNSHPWKKIRRSTKSDLQCSSSSSSSSSVQYGVQVQEGPSCIFVGPLETATKDMLEALYQQTSCCPFVVMGENVGPFSAPVSDARDSYYSGRPLILDDMFDKVELKLRWYRSKSVVKYPRCSLKRQSTYADAEVDPSQTWALASIWISLLVIGMTALIVPPVCTLSEVCQDALNMQLVPRSSTLASESLAVANVILAVALGSSIGYPITVASVRALQGLWRNDLVALKGSCPGCGEEVFAFVRADESVRPRHKTECHVCQRPLVFHARVEHSMSNPGSRWVYGRVYLVARIKDLSPRSSSLTDRSPQE